MFTTQPHDVVTAGTISFIKGGLLVGLDDDTQPTTPQVCVLAGPDHHAAIIASIDEADPVQPFLVR